MSCASNCPAACSNICASNDTNCLSKCNALCESSCSGPCSIICSPNDTQCQSICADFFVTPVNYEGTFGLGYCFYQQIKNPTNTFLNQTRSNIVDMFVSNALFILLPLFVIIIMIFIVLIFSIDLSWWIAIVCIIVIALILSMAGLFYYLYIQRKINDINSDFATILTSFNA